MVKDGLSTLINNYEKTERNNESYIQAKKAEVSIYRNTDNT